MKKCVLSLVALVFAMLLLLPGCAAPASATAGQPVQSDPFSVQVKMTDQQDGKIMVRTATPVFSGFSAAAELNEKIANLSQEGIAQMKEETKDLGETAGADSLYYSSFFDYSRSGDLLSVWVSSANYTGGAHGMHWMNSFTVNTKTGKFYSTPSALFQEEESGTKWITAQISKKISEQKDVYFPEAQKTLTDKNGKYSFYLDGDTMVVYFDLYELQPYAAGIPTFEFPAKELAENGVPLKEKLTNTQRRGAVRLNGEDISLKHPVVSNDDGVFLPLEETVALLGKSVEVQQDNYFVNGQPAQVEMVDGVAYAPLTFFTQTLGELVFYDDSALRIFPKTPNFVPMGVGGGSADSSKIPATSSKMNAMLIFPGPNISRFSNAAAV